MRQLKISQKLTLRNEGSISRYFLDINKFGLISPEEEAELTARIRNGDTLALEKLIVANLRFVVSVAKQYQFQGLSFPDLINEGNIGLMKAATKFDETRGFKFISYAVWWIRQSIVQAISNNTRIVRLPLNRITTINKIRNAIPLLEQKHEREPTVAEIAEFLDLTNDEVEVANSIRKNQISFDMPIRHDDGNDTTLYDFVQTGNVPLPDNSLMNESLVISVKRALNKLSKREADIITMSYGLQGTPVFSMNYIAIKFDMSIERVRQIRITGLTKLKNMLNADHAYMV